MELVDIKYAKDKRVGQLSGGQKQKASLVASLVHRPDILFLDEPTIGLDPTTKRTLWDLIRELNDNGHTIILCSHDMHEVDMLCEFQILIFAFYCQRLNIVFSAEVHFTKMNNLHF